MNWPIQNREIQKFPMVGRICITILMIATISLGIIPTISFARIAQEPGAGNETSEVSGNETPTLSAVTKLYDREGLDETQESDKQEVEDRVKTIHDRIKQLKSVLAKERAAAEAGRLKASQINASNSPPAIPGPAASAELNPLESSSVEAPVAAQPNIELLQPEAIEENSELPSPTNPLPDGIQVLANPVNSFELANSLFATGSYDQALKSYESLLQDEVDEYDRNWLLCLSASCYRLQGDISKAESRYREVIATGEKSYSADYSQWFLDHVTNKKQIQEEFRLLSGELGNLAPGDLP